MRLKTKRIIIFILTLSLLLPALFACVNPQDDSNISSVSPEVSGGQDESQSTVFTYKTAVSIGKSYTKSDQAGDAYPDTYSSELTDGVFVTTDAPSYTEERLSGYATRGLEVIINLEQDGKRLYCFEASYLSTTEAGVAPPSAITVYSSDNGSDWTRLGRCDKPVYEENTMQKAACTLDSPIDANYIRFTFSGNSAWMFIDELTVYADVKDESSAVLEETVMQLYRDDKTTDAELTENIASVSGGLPDTTKEKNIISKGVGYKLSRPSSSTLHTDTGKLLTDGATVGSHYESGAWVGFEGSEALDITLDLGAYAEDICAFELSAFSRTATGIYFPACVDILVSENGTDFIKIARIYSPTSSSMTNYSFYYTAENCIKARYIRFSIPETERQWLLIEETAVYAYRDVEAAEPMYPALSITQVSGITRWPHSSDYSNNQNLILGRTQQIVDAVGLTKAEAENYCTPVSSTLLTDGIKANVASPSTGSWFRTWGGLSRDIFYDLEYHSTVTGFSVQFLQYKSWGISIPASISLYLSDDGVHWYLVKTETNRAIDGDTGICSVNINLAQPTVARFARFSFLTGTHVYLDELELWGTKEIKTGISTLDTLGITPEVIQADGSIGDYAQADSSVLSGAKDIMLAYHSTGRKLDREFFLAYAAYLNDELKISDTMFDAFLFLPSTGNLPSGGRPYGESIKSDWDSIFESLFNEGENLDALNQAVGEMKEALGLGDYKVKVFLTLMHPSPNITNFGDVDGDGVTEDLSKLEDIQKVVEWYVERCEKAFEETGYENLELCGWYWFHEAINTSELDEKSIQNAADYLNGKGTQLFWIPYYRATGYNIWKHYGFNAAYMQPNYAFSLEVRSGRIEEAVKQIKRYSMSIEIEIDTKALSNEMFYKKYMEYLAGGITYGYMTGSAHAYYQSVEAFYRACHSEDAKIRLIYDYTYQFIKGTLELSPEKPENGTISTDKNTPVTGAAVDDAELMSVMITASPKHGTVSVNSDGSFIYYPNKDFSGTDSFSFSVSKQLGWSESAEVIINVG